MQSNAATAKQFDLSDPVIATEFDAYQQHVTNTVVRESAFKLEFLALALCGEAGEFAEKVAKHIRGDYEMTDERREAMAKELGDLLWYMSRCASVLNYSLSDVARMNNEKLAKRRDTQVINGDGDNR